MKLNVTTYIIIVTFNSKKWLEKCFESIINSEIAVRVIVVDNNSADGTPQTIKEKYPQFELIQLEKNIGFAKANNIGIYKALQDGADYLFLLNHDAWIEPVTIRKLVEVSEYNPSYGILSPIHLNGSGSLLDWNFSKYISQPYDEGRKLYSDLLLKNKLQVIYNVKYVNAAAWLLSRNCIETVGLFEDNFIQQNGEDTNYLQRVYYHNLKVGVVPEVFIYHDREDRKGTATKSQLMNKYLIQRFVLNGLNVADNEGVLKMEQQLRIEQKTLLKSILKLKLSESIEIYKNIRKMKKMMPEIMIKRNKYKERWQNNLSISSKK